MKTITKALLAISISAMTAFSIPAMASAPAASGQTFGVVDMNRVLQTTDAAKSIFKQMDSRRKRYQDEISKAENSLRSSEEELQKQKDTLSKDAFETKQKAIEEKVVDGQRMVQNRRQILDQAFSTAMGSLRRSAAQIVAHIAKEKHYSAVFTDQAVMMSMPDMDMTKAVIDQMNKKVRHISIDWKQASRDVDAMNKSR